MAYLATLIVFCLLVRTLGEGALAWFAAPVTIDWWLVLNAGDWLTLGIPVKQMEVSLEDDVSKAP